MPIAVHPRSSWRLVRLQGTPEQVRLSTGDDLDEDDEEELPEEDQSFEPDDEFDEEDFDDDFDEDFEEDFDEIDEPHNRDELEQDGDGEESE